MTEATETYVEGDPPSAPISLGWVMIVGGVLAVGVAFFFDVGVSSGAGGLYGIPDRVANTDKMAIRSMILACGLAGFVSGWISLSAGLILEEIKKRH